MIAEGTSDELKDQVGGERLEVTLEDRRRRRRRRSRRSSRVAAERPALDDGVLRVPVRERKGAIAEAVRRLDEAGIGIDDIAMRRPTLDDVFLTLTGHARRTTRTTASSRRGGER